MQNADSDIIVIGAGGCGLMAALVAAKKGAPVLLLEKTDKPGGGTAFSSKGIRAAASRRQRELKIHDDAGLYAQDILRRNNGESDAVLTRRLAETSGRVADFLTDEAGIEFQIGEFAFGHSAQRSHSWKADKTVTDFLFAAVEREKKIQVRFSTPVLALQPDDGGAVVGVKTDDGILTARRIILASGGFGASAELLSRYIPKAVGIPFPGHHGSTGDGIKMGLEVGAAIENMGAFQPYPAYIGPGKRAVAPEVALSGGIMVDAAGRRFVDETRYPGGLGIKMLDLPGKQAYEIFDERIFKLHRNAPGLRSLSGFFDAGLLLKGETPETLAGKLGIDAEGLKQTIRDCNERAASGDKDAFGRVLPQPFEGPYYGIKVTVALYHTQGGLKVNADGQVLRADGSIISNLYAGGGVAVGVSGKGLEGYLPGNGLLASLGLGMIAAEHAVASLNGN
ncbi:MAG TPA: FAD-dependent oxidoreductase [Candidatus Binatia bacterium]|jgi:fumarate reductase flavoprotein subunit|nr:FAD-dependent oxidoreductase [Candidatus Binatia bacterium]